jgi:hypothetical protein
MESYRNNWPNGGLELSSPHDTHATTARTLSPFDEAAARCPLLGEQQQQQQQSSPRKWTLFGPHRSSPTTTMLSTEYRNHGSGVETIDFINLNGRSDEHGCDNADDSDEEMQTIFARLPFGMRPGGGGRHDPAARGNSPLIQLCEIRKGA